MIRMEAQLDISIKFFSNIDSKTANLFFIRDAIDLLEKNKQMLKYYSKSMTLKYDNMQIVISLSDEDIISISVDHEIIIQIQVIARDFHEALFTAKCFLKQLYYSLRD
ncbi:MAG: hypothetical protein QXP36_12340 [Conexivisphaerales archaeon]